MNGKGRKETRRAFLKSTAATAAACAVLGAKRVHIGKRTRKPNLLFLWTDEQRADTMAVYGNRAIHTPNLNRFSQECVVFDQAYVSQPVCTPSRSTVMTGLWPHTNGCTQNNIALPTDVRTFPEIVNDPDYRTGYFGKWHLGDEIFAQHEFEEWRAIEDMYYRYYREGRDMDAKSSYSHFLRERGYEPDSSGGLFSRKFAARLPIEHCKPKFLELEACDFLRRHRDEPFMLYVNFLEPHMPFFGPLDDEHDPREVTLPANYGEPIEENEPETYRQRYIDFVKNGYKEYDLTQEQDMRRLTAKYWGLVTQVDRSVGAILAMLENLGLADDTIVVYTSDHGDMMGSHYMMTKTVMYEESVRVPWLMRVPELGRKGRAVKRPVGHIDMVPTLLDLMGAGSDAELPGQSLRPLMTGGKVEEDHVFIEWNRSGTVAGGRNPGGKLRRTDVEKRNSTRTVVSPDGWKLCLNDLDKNQLFDLNNDPGEAKNLYDSGRHGAIIRRLAAKIAAWQDSVADDLEVCV